MKKLLALVLALVMTLGLATVGANAATTAYKDADKINYKEAVDVMSAVGILAGDETGFRPTDNLKRSEGAKIIAYMLLGNKNADSLSGSGAKFSDVPANHWAAGYIEYLAAQGVIGGVGDGKFNPDGTLTTVQFAKMLLVALGYDAEIEKLGGPDWAINTQKLANQTDVKLFKGNNNVSANSNITREEAALYAFNTLRTPLVQYENKGTSINVNGASITTGASNVSYKTDTAARTQKISQKRLNEGMAGAAATPFLVEFAEFYYPDLELVGQDEGFDDLGRPTRKWTYKNAEIGTYAMSEWLVKTWEKKATAKDVYDTVGQGIYDSLIHTKFRTSNGKRIGESGTTLTVFEDGVNRWTNTRVGAANGTVFMGDDNATADFSVITKNDTAAHNPFGIAPYNVTLNTQGIDYYVSRTDTTKISNSDNGSVTELYQDDDNNLILVTYHTYLYKAVGNYDEKGATIELVDGNDNSVQLEDYKIKAVDFPAIKDFKDDDYILVTAAQINDNGEYKVKSVAKAEILTGKVDTYDTGSSQAVTIDGTTYKYSKTAVTDDKNTKYTVGQKTSVVMDGHGFIIAVDSAQVSDDYVFVINWGSSSNLGGDARAKVVFADGTNSEVAVKSVEDPANNWTRVKASGTISGWNNDATRTNKWFTYSKDSDGKYAFYSPESKYSQKDSNTYTFTAGGDNKIAENNKAKFLDNISLLANEQTIVVVKDVNDEYQVFKGVKNTPEIELNAAGATATAYLLYNTKNSYIALAYIEVGGNATVSGGTSQNLIYVIKYQTETTGANGDKWFTYVTLDGTTEVKQQADTRITALGDNIYTVAWYVSKNSKDQLTGFEKVTDKTSVAGGHVGKVYADSGVMNSIDYKDGVITFVDSYGTRAFSVTNSTKTTLLTNSKTGTASIMQTDKAADYEVSSVTGASGTKNLISRLKNYSYTYDYAVKTTGTDDMVAEEIFITIQDADKASTISASSYNTPALLAAAINTELASTDKVTVTGNLTGSNALSTALALTANKTLVFSGNVEIAADMTFLGTVNVQGNLITKAGFTLTNNGKLTVGGKLTDNGSVTNNGTMTVSGETVSTSSTCITNNGTMSLNDVTLTGEGTLTSSNAAAKINIGGNVAVNSGTTLTLNGAENAINGTLTVASGAAGVTLGDVKIGDNFVNKAAANTITITGDVEVVNGKINADTEFAGSGTLKGEFAENSAVKGGAVLPSGVVYDTAADTTVHTLAFQFVA